MTRDDIIRMAREAGYTGFDSQSERLHDFAALILAANKPEVAFAAEAEGADTNEIDPNGKDQHEAGAKLDAGKILPWLCISGFAHALTAVADVTTKGARKYTPNGWTTVPNGQERYMEAFARHALALARGEMVDQDTQCLHKAQMIWNLLASLELELRDAVEWDRK